MNVSVENLGPCKKLLRIEVPVEQVNAAFDTVTASFQKQAQLPGFRAGKAPKHMIVKSYESQINDEVRKKLFGDSYAAASSQEKLRILATLDVEELTFGRGLPFSYTATLENAPEFEVPEYKGLKAQRPVAQPTEADVERALNILREQQVRYNDVARALQADDIAVVNYKGTLDGKPLTDEFPTARGLTEKQNFWVQVKEESFIPGFTTPLVGASAGDKRTVPLTLPADFVIAGLSSKNVVYELEVVGVKEKVLPALDDEFAKGFGAEDLVKLTEGIRQDLKNELEFRGRKRCAISCSRCCWILSPLICRRAWSSMRLAMWCTTSSMRTSSGVLLRRSLRSVRTRFSPVPVPALRTALRRRSFWVALPSWRILRRSRRR